jgi:hypothetical protein
MAGKQGKVFEKSVVVTRQIRRRGEKEYEYGMVWVLLPKEYIGKEVLVRVYLVEDGQKPQPQVQAQSQAPEKSQENKMGDFYEKIRLELLKREFERLRENAYRWPYG